MPDSKTEQRIQVIGGGFAGLSLAYFLGKRGKNVILVEKSGRMGGLIRTLQTPYGPVETAANALLGNSLVEEVARDLGVELVRVLPSAKKRFIFRKGRARIWPLSIKGSINLLYKFLIFIFKRSSFRPMPEESIENWGHRCLGEEATKFLLIPALTGIYAGDPKRLSASLILGRYFGATPSIKSTGSTAPRGGMEQWTEGFLEKIRKQGAQFSNQPQEGIPTIVALPPLAASQFLLNRAPGLAQHLKNIEMVSLLSVTCFFPSDAGSFGGFGCLFPRGEGFRVLGILCNDRIFPERAQGCLSETWIFGGASDGEVLDLSNESLEQIIWAERKKMFGKDASPLHLEISRWPNAIPHYELGLEKILEDLAPMQEGKYRVFGTYLGELGLARLLVAAKKMADSY